jgi:alpha-L-rhamnosidase
MYGFYSTDIMARTAEILGRTEDAAQWKKHAEAQRVAFNRKHFHAATNAYVNDSQTANLLPLAFGIVEPEHRQAVADRVAADAEARGGHHTTGFLGTAYVLPVLADHGYADLAYRILSREAFPSLGYMLNQGATTVWERWNTDQEGPGMNSRNHFAFGSMAQWMFEGLAGLNPDPDQPGFRHVIIRPQVVGDLNEVEVDYPCPFGELEAGWTRDGQKFEMEVTLPPNTYGTLHLPATDAASVRESGKPASQARGVRFIKHEQGRAHYELQSGNYRFTSTLP